MTEQLSMLVVNGDTDTNERLAALPGLRLTTAQRNGDNWGDILASAATDVLVVEVSTAGNVSATLERIERARAAYPDLAIIVTSSSKSPDVIIAAMRSGAQEFLSKPIDSGELNQALERCRRRKEAATGRRHPGTLISVFSTTGGAGVTTLAVNLGVSLAQGGANRAALVDLNLQHGDAASLLNLEPRYSIVDACDDADQVSTDKLQSCMTPHASGLSILSEPSHPAASDIVTAHHVHSVLTQLIAMYPYVIVDLPHMFEPRVMAALEMSGTILLTTVATIPALRATRKVMALFKELGYATDRVRLVINRVSRNDRIETSEIARALLCEPFWTLPNNYMATSDALNTGQPLVTQKRLSNVAKSILEMAETIGRISSNGSR